jgi:hypothetical protein
MDGFLLEAPQVQQLTSGLQNPAYLQFCVPGIGGHVKELPTTKL